MFWRWWNSAVGGNNTGTPLHGLEGFLWQLQSKKPPVAYIS